MLIRLKMGENGNPAFTYTYINAVDIVQITHNKIHMRGSPSIPLTDSDVGERIVQRLKIGGIHEIVVDY